MKVIKPNGLSVLSRPYENDGQCFLSVAVLFFFAFGPEERLLSEVDLWKLVPQELGETPLDLCMPKLRGDVLVTGKAYPHGARPVCSVRLTFGQAIDKTLWVVGDREWNRTGPSDPVPFTEMPVSYERAFGGPGFAHNPTGKGFAPVAGVHPLPNVENPRALVKSPRDRPEPAGFGPLDFAWPQRASKAGTYDAKWRKARYPGFPDDMDWTIFQSAPDDQQTREFFRGDEAFTVENMHPSKARLEGKLPGVVARVFLRHKGEDALHQATTRLDTLHLFPHAERAVLVSRALSKVAEDDAFDVAHLLVACERIGEPKPVAHYEQVLAARLDEKRGVMASMRDSDLMPARREGGPKLPAPPADPALELEGRLRKRMRARQEAMHRELVAKVTAMGGPEAAKQVPPFPPEPVVPEAEDLEAVAAQMTAEAEKARVDAEAKKAEAEKSARAAFAARGLDYDAAMKSAAKEGAGPPRPVADEQLARMRKTVQAAKDAGMPVGDLERQLADPRTEARLREVDVRTREAYQKLAHMFPAAQRLEEESAARLRTEVLRARAARESLAGRDLTGADLAGIDLGGADLQGALLEAAKLAGAQLGGADLRGAVLARADLSGANLFCAKMAGANLGEAKLAEAELAQADLEDAVLAKADLTRARLRGAILRGADLHEATFVHTDLSRAAAPQAIFLRADLSTATLAEADLTKAIFVECVLKKTDMTGAHLHKASFVAAKADGAVLAKADLAGASFVKESRFAGADFQGATLDGANLRGAMLEGADFRGASLAKADLSECNLRGARLRVARAHGAQLVRADLTDAELEEIDLMDGSLAKANITRADLSRANLFGVDFAKTRGNGANLRGANTKRTRVVPVRGGAP
jgi:uncharacterized protein YjbI with pentapeptide repeats